ncbi:MAG TPA: hypothetical protein VFE45_16670 [Coriobacteriia bacterium]|nr:hypothetical protein [Coriobacteriia bacterium]
MAGNLPGWSRYRAKRAWIDGGYVEAELDLEAAYLPETLPNLPTALAKVVDERTAVGFVTTYGTLGWWQHPRTWKGSRLETDTTVTVATADRVSWVLDQAGAVRFALDLVEAIKHGHSDAHIQRVLGPKRLDQPEVQFYHYFAPMPGQQGWTMGTGTLLAVPLPDSADWRAHAGAVVAGLVNSNTTSVRLTLSYSDGFRLHETTDALIEQVWRHVGAAAVGGPIRRCDECQTPFVVTDQRQRFCPPAPWEKKSRCAERHRKRDTRTRHRTEYQKPKEDK